MAFFSFCLTLLLVSFCKATPKDRVVKDVPLSKEEHWRSIGGEDGGENEHNVEYDHEAFLGKDAARDYEGLSPEESKKRLGQLYDRIDKNADGKVDEDELKNWIKYTQNKYIWEDAKKQMKTNDENMDGYVDWEEYKKTTYGFIADDEDTAKQYNEMIGRDERRFKRADKDNSGKLNREEFTSFLHPENDEDMKGIVVEETIDDIDKDKDGFISLDEYVGDLWPEEDREKEAEPEWVKTEKQQFKDYRDKNKDGKMDKEEVAAWILPPEYDHIDSEAKHLIAEADADNDGKLSKDEMVDKHNVFVGSQATDFGEALKYLHEDL